MNDRAARSAPRRFALGARGERPIWMPHIAGVDARAVLAIPGVIPVQNGYAMTWDAAPFVAPLLGLEPPVPPIESNVDLGSEIQTMRGHDRFVQSGLLDKLRSYQVFGAVFMARRSFAMNCDPMRCVANIQPIELRVDGMPKFIPIEEHFAKTERRVNTGRWGDRVMEARSWNGERLGYRPVFAIHHTGKRQCVVITTKDKHSVIVGAEHKFYTANDELIAAHELRPDVEILSSGKSRSTGRGTGFLIPRPTKVNQILPVGPMNTYDITMVDWKKPIDAAKYNSYTVDGLVCHNSGKSVQALAASMLTGSEKTLIICPAIARLVWAEEIAKWLGEEALVLEGRAGTKARTWCAVCNGRGRVAGERCPGCRLKNGQSNGLRLHVGDDAKAALDVARYVVVNYDLLVAQLESDAAGREHTRADLVGQVPNLIRQHFDVAILDEIHAAARRFDTNEKRRGHTRRDRLVQLVDRVPQVWGLTGTPIFGFLRDLWGQLDVVSNGAMTGQLNRLPFQFHTYYCEGGKTTYGWKADGRSPAAETELPVRMSYYKLQRPRSEILKDMPAKQRQVIRLDYDRSLANQGVEAVTAAMKQAAQQAELSASVGAMPRPGRVSKLVRALSSTAMIKREALLENVVNELLEENKVIVFALLRSSVEELAKALQARLNDRDTRTRTAAVKAKVWAAHGGLSSDGRFAFARAFREHEGAGVFIATIDSVQVALSLRGATSVHFQEFHWQPAAMLQAEDRPYEPGTTGLTIVYYVVKDSIDAEMEDLIMPKLETQRVIVGEEGAAATLNALNAGGVADEGLDETIRRLTAKLPSMFLEED